jgi:hypothetical protein
MNPTPPLVAAVAAHRMAEQAAVLSAASIAPAPAPVWARSARPVCRSGPCSRSSISGVPCSSPSAVDCCSPPAAASCSPAAAAGCSPAAGSSPSTAAAAAAATAAAAAASCCSPPAAAGCSPAAAAGCGSRLRQPAARRQQPAVWTALRPWATLSYVARGLRYAGGTLT